MTWLKNLFSFIAYIIGQIKASKPPVPDPVPTPEPLPPLPPTPVEPVPEPVPLTEMVLFDLPQTAVDMNNQGFPGREGVVLYALGQVANGWPIPGQSDELIQVATFYDQIWAWYNNKVFTARIQLNDNPRLTLTILTNDQKDRFGCRIGPPTYERLREFGDRVQMGYYVPESEY